MNQEVKDLWINALESGQYGQAFSVFEDMKGNHCALGVLLELAHTSRLKQGLGHNFIEDAMNWAQLTTEQWVKVMSLNDRERVPFPELAIWIKENL